MAKMNSKLVAVLLILNANQGLFYKENTREIRIHLYILICLFPLLVHIGILLVTAADFVCPDPDGFFPADDLCSDFYYTCVNGTAFPMVWIHLFIHF